MQLICASSLRRLALVHLALAALTTAPLAQVPSAENDPRAATGERLPDWALGPGLVESMEAVRARAHLGLKSRENPKARNGAQGVWSVPSMRWTRTPHSGEHYAFAKWGDTRMGLGLGRPVTLEGVWVAGHAQPAAWTDGLRVVGFRGGERVAETAWFEPVEESPRWFPIALVGVDRVEFEARPVYEGGGFFSIDDLTFTTAEGERVVLDFEELGFGASLTGSGYGGLDWETGTGDFSQEVLEISPPATPPGSTDGAAPGTTEVTETTGADGTATAPSLRRMFTGPRQAGLFQSYIPPDTCGAVGTNHFVAVVNQDLAVYDKSTGAELFATSLPLFFNTGSLAGDPRVAFDPHHERWIVIATNFTDRLRFAYSLTDDPLGEWFKKSFIVSLDSDTGAWPDYPTLGVDANGIYTGCYMVGNNHRMSLFCIDKATLLAPTPTLSTVTAFRQLPFEGALQPAVTWGPAPGEYVISRASSTSQRIRRVDPPLSAPTLTEVGFAPTIVGNWPPSAPALGSVIALDTVDHRLMNAVYRDGSLWSAHTVSKSGRAAINWYEIGAATATTIQQGTIQDPVNSFYIPSIAVDSAGNALLAFSGSSPLEFAGCWRAGRMSTDPAGQMSDAERFKPGGGPYNQTGGTGINRWGDYSLTCADPVDDTLWTIQEHARGNGDWGTRIAQFEFGCGNFLNYCTPGISASGCQATVSHTGTPSVSAASGFTIDISQVEGLKDGLIFCGSNGQQASPWGNGTSLQCVVPPVSRTGLQLGNGTAGSCDGVFSIDFNHWMAANPATAPRAGTVVQIQAWYRDPLTTSNQTTSLSNAGEFSICP